MQCSFVSLPGSAGLIGSLSPRSVAPNPDADIIAQDHLADDVRVRRHSRARSGIDESIEM
jgi:hypothetical protein